MKIKGPLHSDKTSGTILDFLTFSRRRTLQLARWQKKQKDKKSAGQLEQREKFLRASLACRFMEQGEAILGVFLLGVNKNFWEEQLPDKGLTSYNFCIKEYLKNI